jgi:RNA polymerase-binding protein DksA
MTVMQDYAVIKEHLLNRRNEIIERLNRVVKHLRHSDSPLDDDFAEQAVERANDQVLEALDDKMREEVLQIDHAISLIDSGKYGICEYCGRQIHEKRLDALPFTNVCINCAH